MASFIDQLNSLKTSSSGGGTFTDQLNALLGTPKTPTQPIATAPTVNPKIAQYQAEQIGYDKAAKDANSFNGILNNTIYGLPKAAVDTAKSIGQGIARTVGTVGITAGNIPAQITGTEKPFQESIDTTGNPFTNALFGGKPITTVQKQTADVQKFLSPYIGQTGSKISALPLVLGSIAMDLSGFGGGKAVKLASGEIPETFLKLLARKSDPVVLENTMRAVGLDEANAKALATKLAPTKTVQEVKDVLIAHEPVTTAPTVTKDQLQSQINLTKELLAEHPGTKLNKLIPDRKLKTNYLDRTTGENLSLSVLKANAKKSILNQKLQSVFEGTPESNQFDNYYVIEKAKEDAKVLKERLKALQEQKRNLPKVQISEEGIPMARKSVPYLPKTIENQPQILKPSLLDTTTGEGRSLEITANKALEESAQHTIPPKDVSLIDTVSKEPTKVKDKVNIIDYIRTPDRVLKKIGLEKEGNYLRAQHDKYLKELPKNIDKITAWSKRASKGGNADIFNYLDGKAIDLKPQDKIIATEIQSWLKQWAERLHLPEDNRITYYITHIFDQELIKKEFPEELAKMIDNKLPGEVYDPFLEKRLGTLGYRQDTWKALDAYAKRATRKVHMDPALEKIKDASGKLEQSQYDYVKKYIANINMRPNKIDTLIDNGIKSVIGYKLGQRPLLTTTKFLRQMTFRAMLGLNPASALKNISQGINTYAKLGEKYTTIGYAKLFSKGSKTELEAEGVLNGGFIEDRALSATKKAIEKFDKGLFIFFETAEHINRGAAYFGAKAQGLAKGMGEREAIDYAKSIVRKTQFVFGKIDTPLALSSDLGKTLGQFQSYGTKQIEFLSEMVKKAATGDEKAKNFIGLLRYAVAGTVFVYTVGQAFNMKISDLIPSVRIGTPPSLKLPYEIGRAVVNAPGKYGNERDLGQKLKDIGSAGLGLIPAGTQLKKTYQGYQALQQGKSTDASGRTQYDVGGTPLKDAQALIFGKYSGQGAQDYYQNDMTYAEATLAKLKASPTGKADLAKIIKENPALAESILKVVKKQALGITKDDEKLLNMGVATKQRAKEVAKQINKLDNKEAKKALIVEYIKKKIITDDVAKQLAEFLTK